MHFFFSVNNGNFGFIAKKKESKKKKKKTEKYLYTTEKKITYELNIFQKKEQFLLYKLNRLEYLYYVKDFYNNYHYYSSVVFWNKSGAFFFCIVFYTMYIHFYKF